MIEYGLTIDPGLETGVCLFSFGPDQPFKIEHVWQFAGGAWALAVFLHGVDLHVDARRGLMLGFSNIEIKQLIVEKFTPRPHETFSLTLKAVEPLRGEGVLIGAGFEPFIDWQEPAEQYFMGASTLELPEKKKAARKFLETHGMKMTGSTVGRPDANDAISATLHSIAWLRHKRHMPTLEQLFGEGKMSNNAIPPSIATDITGLFRAMGESQRKQQDAIGFGAEGNNLREINADVYKKWSGLAMTDENAKQQLVLANAALRNYYIAKLALITTEVAEAIEEIRHGHTVNERYYSSEPDGVAVKLKPEGVPSELADIVIRCWSLAGEAGIELGEAIVEKLEYNATRAQKHGGKAI